MSIYDDEYFYDDDDDDDDDFLGREAGQVSCKYCGSRAVRWQETPSGWRLYDIRGGEHSCESVVGVSFDPIED